MRAAGATSPVPGVASMRQDQVKSAAPRNWEPDIVHPALRR